MTKVNYTAFFYCAKYAAAIMKLQQQYTKKIIFQISSRSTPSRAWQAATKTLPMQEENSAVSA
jgi:hypothetical protein